MSLQICYTLSFTVKIVGPESYGLPKSTTNEELVAKLKEYYDHQDMMIEDAIDQRDPDCDLLVIQVLPNTD